MKTIYLGLGSNLGDRKVNLRRALKMLPPRVQVAERSPVYETEPMYLSDQPLFYNMVVRARTELSPVELLQHVKKVEKSMGRARESHNQPRVIDIDILFYNDKIIETEELEVPHPKISERAFVLAPMSDIAPKFIHPVLNISVEKMLSRLPDWKEQVKLTSVRV